jgi:hypothetical protein
MDKLIKILLGNSWLFSIIIIIVGIYLLGYWILNKEVRNSYKRRSEENLINQRRYFDSYMAKNYSILFMVSIICIVFGIMTLLMEFEIIK